jgi:hypothetical protein
MSIELTLIGPRQNMLTSVEPKSESPVLLPRVIAHWRVAILFYVSILASFYSLSSSSWSILDVLWCQDRVCGAIYEEVNSASGPMWRKQLFTSTAAFTRFCPSIIA